MFRILFAALLILSLIFTSCLSASAGDSENTDDMVKTEEGDVHTHGGDIDLEQGDIEDAKNTTTTYVWTDTVTATGVLKGPRVQANQLTSNGDSTIKVYNGVDGQGNLISNVNSVQVTNAVPAGNNYLASKYYVDQLHVQSESLYGGNHTLTDCFNANGYPEGYNGAILCNIAGSSCPSGWSAYPGNPNTTDPVQCNLYEGGGANREDYCTTGAHSRLSTASDASCSPTNSSISCSSRVVGVGCY